jgi:hypothetical protein
MRKRLLVLLMAAMMVVMSAAPVMAAPKCGLVEVAPGFFVYLCENQGHKADDNADPDQGGGNNHIKQNQGKGYCQSNPGLCESL